MILRLKKVSITLLVLANVLVSLSLVSPAVHAAACSNSSNYGVATMTVSVPAAGDYRIWSRMKVPSSAASTYQLEADGNTCWQIGGANVPTNTWTWVDWTGGNSAQKVNYTFTAGNHTLKLIGSSANVQVDKVILLGAGEQCSDKSTTPTGDGSNCASGPVASSTGSGSQGSTTPVSSGSTTPSIVEENKTNAAQTSYIVNGKVVQSSSGAAPLDTTKLPDGTYDVQTVVTLKDGTEVQATETITVKNNKSFISKYTVIIIVAGVVALVIGVLLALWWLLYRGYGAVLSDKFKKPSNSAVQSQQTSTDNYAEPEVIKPSDKS